MTSARPHRPAPGQGGGADVGLAAGHARTDPAWHPVEEPATARRRTAGEVEDGLRVRLRLAPRGHRPLPQARVWGWLGPLLVTALAAVLRLAGLNHPGRLIFDETYYVKQAFSLLTLGYEGDWPDEDADERLAAGDTSALSTEADYVVHPQVGKWMIALGIRWLGVDNGAGWRVAAALTGTLAVLLVARVAIRLFGSPLLGTVAGLLLAVDGMHLTGSRTALLDSFLMFWVLVGFWAVLRDRDASRARLAREAAAEITAGGWLLSRWGPRIGVRWWLVGAGVALGLATGVKWSGLYAAAVFGILVFCWDTAARRAVGARGWVAGGVLRGGVPAFLALVPTVAVTYLAGWWSWFASPAAYMRGWATEQRQAGGTVERAWLPDALNSWWEYHLRMWDFHTGLDSEHSYEAHPVGWLVQWRPTSFYWPEEAAQDCGAERCVEAITSLGNPLLWWLAAAALVLVVWLALRERDWRAWAILAGYGAMYLPWLGYAHRTIFTFYAVAFVPFVVLALTCALGWATDMMKPADASGTGAPPRDRATAPAAHLADDDADGDSPHGDEAAPGRTRPAERWAGLVHADGDVVVSPPAWVLLGTVVTLILGLSAFFWPVWTGQPISYAFWHAHMWLPSWI